MLEPTGGPRQSGPGNDGRADRRTPCLCARSTYTRPLLARVCGVGVCGLDSGFGCAPPLLAGVLGCVYVFVCALSLYPASPGCGVWCGRVGLGSGFVCAPPLLAGVLGCVCVFMRAPPVPRHSWLPCVVWVFVLGLRFRLRPALSAERLGPCVSVCALRVYPAIPGWSVPCRCVCFGLGFGCALPLLHGGFGAGVCLCARSACTPPLLVGVCGVGVGAFGSGFSCAPPLLAGVFGCVCVCVRAPLVPCHSWLRCVLWVCVLGLGSRLRPATLG